MFIRANKTASSGRSRESRCLVRTCFLQSRVSAKCETTIGGSLSNGLSPIIPFALHS